MVNLFPFIPLSIAFLFALLLSLIYILALIYSHVNPVYPFISDSGATHPEAAYFSYILYLIAILVGIMSWIRYKQIKYFIHNNPKQQQQFNNNDNNVRQKSKSIDEKLSERLSTVFKLDRLNTWSLYMSIIQVLSLPAVAAFRSTESLELHLLVGAVPVFSASLIYFLMQTHITYLTIPYVGTLKMARFRLLVSILSIIFGTCMLFGVLFSALGLKRTYADIRGPSRLVWDESYGGYVGHVVSTVAENVAIFMMCPFYASFYPEFRRIETQNRRLKFKFNEINF
ncbi:DNA damage-regulated autophagy modulator protein 2-like [Oppia nitens]|uniref:DNA damage-regulated autophagy modulator protein 2-like n=1 Tax=Oppia nitens TaxID=1686743 RepID=UPI0023DB1626|nr:DNA damage-regulated autophagy modulator protein 2-like [Oppia nitens]